MQSLYDFVFLNGSNRLHISTSLLFHLHVRILLSFPEKNNKKKKNTLWMLNCLAHSHKILIVFSIHLAFYNILFGHKRHKIASHRLNYKLLCSIFLENASPLKSWALTIAAGWISNTDLSRSLKHWLQKAYTCRIHRNISSVKMKEN